MGDSMYKRIIALLFVLLFTLSLFYLAVEADHECSGEDCAVCTVLGQCLQLIGLAAIVSLAALAGLFCAARNVDRSFDRAQDGHAITPVSLHVKLSN